MMDHLQDQQHQPTRRARVNRTPEFKRELVRLCLQPDASLSGVAVAHGVNPNLLRRWVRQAEQKGKPTSFVPVVVNEQRCQTTHSDKRQSQSIHAVIEKAGLNVRLTADPANCIELGQVLREIFR